MQAFHRRLALALATATGTTALVVSVAAPAATPSRWPSPLTVTSPEGRSLVNSPRAKTVVVDTRTGQVTAIYSGTVPVPQPAAPPSLRIPWHQGTDNLDS